MDCGRYTGWTGGQTIRLILITGCLGCLWLTGISAQNLTGSKRIANGWGPWDPYVHSDSITAPRYRVETLNRSGRLTRIDFYTHPGRHLQKVHEFVYDRRGHLLKELVYNQDGHLKWYYFYDYDPIVMDWRMIKYSPRGEYMDSQYLQEINFDTTWIDPSYFIVKPGQAMD